MWRRSGWQFGRMALVLLGCTWCWALPGTAQDTVPTLLLPAAETSRDWYSERRAPSRDLGNLALLAPLDEMRPRRRRARLDLSPFAHEILNFLRAHGLPLEEQRDEHGKGPVGVYADVSVGEDLPAVSFHLGDRPIEPLGAFYPGKKGFRCAVVWPIERFTLRIEGGEDSEFGYFGIAGVQWVHPRWPFAAGIGVPVNLRDADGDIGVIFQFRMTLE